MKKGRTKKVRYVQSMPAISQFSPRGKPGRPEEVQLTIDELEAIKLVDFQGYHQDEGAEFMQISRPSFGRVLRNARKTVADALVNGKIIRIRVGDVQVGVKRIKLPNKRDKQSDLAVKDDNIRKAILKYQPEKKTS